MSSIKLIFQFIHNPHLLLLLIGAGGLLLHCVSGWDRTPLFICLLRCLLWADDLMHCSLTPIQMLYLTLGYDWFLFGHKLKTRMELGEEILRFTFQFIGEMAKCTELSLRRVYVLMASSFRVLLFILLFFCQPCTHVVSTTD